MKARALVLTITALAVAACSNGNDTTPTTTTTPPPSSTTTTTTTTAAPTTTSTSSSTTTTPTTTEPPSPTQTDPVDEVQELLDDYEAAWSAFDAAKLDPTNDATVESARQLLTDRMLELLNERIEQFRRENLRSVTNLDVPAHADVYRETVEIDGDTARFRVCEIGSNILVEVGAAPDGSDAVVNDDVISSLIDNTMVRTPSGWVLARGVVAAEFFGQDNCGEP